MQYIFLIFYPILFLIVGTSNALAQQAGIQRNMQTNLKKTFSYQITSSIGTQTSANVSGNILADTEAILNLKNGGKITNKIGDANGNASAVSVSYTHLTLPTKRIV